MVINVYTIPQLTINGGNMHKPFPNGWFIVVLPPLLETTELFFRSFTSDTPRAFSALQIYYLWQLLLVEMGGSCHQP